MKTLIKGTIIPVVPVMPSEFEGYVTIENNIITDVGMGDITGDFDKVVDEPGLVVMPGLVNTHTHAAMSLLRGVADDLSLMDWLTKWIFPREEKLTGEMIYWGTKLAIAEFLLGGCTCFADMYFFMDDVARAVQECGIRANLSKGTTSFGDNQDEKVKTALDVCLNWHEKANDRIHTMLGPHAIYTCPPDFMKRVVETAKNSGFGIHMHVSETAFEVEECRKNNGDTPVKILDKLGAFDMPFIAAHCVYLTEEEMGIFAAKGVNVALNVSSNFKLASGMPNISLMDKKGLNLTVGTDGPASNNDLNMFEEMRWSAFCAKVSGNSTSVPANKALEMATKNGAKALGWKNLGVLAPGHIADIVVMDYKNPRLTPCYSKLSHAVYACNTSDVKHVMVDGNFVVWNKEITTFDVSEAMCKVEGFAKELA
jgi:5-methylthioadenosine/S-adenosylhomocysteine deaminase